VLSNDSKKLDEVESFIYSQAVEVERVEFDKENGTIVLYGERASRNIAAIWGDLGYLEKVKEWDLDEIYHNGKLIWKKKP